MVSKSASSGSKTLRHKPPRPISTWVEVAPMAKPPVAKAHGLRQVAVHEAAMKVWRPARTRSTRSSRRSNPAEDRHPRRHQEGPCRKVLEGRRQGQGHDHVPWPRAVPPELGFRLLQKLAEDVPNSVSSSPRPSRTVATWSWSSGPTEEIHQARGAAPASGRGACGFSADASVIDTDAGGPHRPPKSAVPCC